MEEFLQLKDNSAYIFFTTTSLHDFDFPEILRCVTVLGIRIAFASSTKYNDFGGECPLPWPTSLSSVNYLLFSVHKGTLTQEKPI